MAIATAVERSDHVFRAVVIGAEVVRYDDQYITEISLAEIVPYKGGLPLFKKLRSRDKTACGMSVSVPGDYWFFVGKDGYVSRCSASSLAQSERVQELERKVIADVIERREKMDDPLGYGDVRRSFNTKRFITIFGAVGILVLAAFLYKKMRKLGRQ